MITAHEIIKLIQDEVMNNDSPLEPETPLFSSGVLDSMQLTSLLLSLEKKYQVTIGVFDISFENFDTPAQIAACIETKKS